MPCFVNISKQICNSCRYSFRYLQKREASWISSRRRAQSSGARSCSRSSIPKCCRAIAPGSNTRAEREAAPFMGELQQKARAAGLWNLGLPELADDEPGTRLSNLEYAPLGRNHGAAVLGLRSLQLPGARRSQHDRAAELRHAGTEAALAAPAARSRHPFGVRHDRARRRLLGRDQYRHHDSAATATITSSTAANGSSPAPRIRAARS